MDGKMTDTMREAIDDYMGKPRGGNMDEDVRKTPLDQAASLGDMMGMIERSKELDAEDGRTVVADDPYAPTTEEQKEKSLLWDKEMVTGGNNFMRIFRVPKRYPEGYLFDGGKFVPFLMVDWFKPVDSGTERGFDQRSLP